MSDVNHDMRNADRLLKLTRIMALFRTISPTMPIQLVQTFLLVAQNEGAGLRELAGMAHAKLPTMSRHLLDLGERNRNMQPGFGLVERVPNPMELRSNQYYLSRKGRNLIEALEGLLD